MEKFPGEVGGPDDKKEIIYRAMYSAQPSFSDFRGYDGYPRRMLQADEEWLECKKEEIDNSEKISADDDFARYMEPIITYILNDEKLLPTREGFAFLASDYDDKRNGTDVIFGVENDKTKENTVFSIDVTTGTSSQSVQSKFQNSFDKHGGESYVKYCMHKDQRWREPNALHFVLGMSPASQNIAAGNIIVKDGELRGREEDVDSDFLLLSEIREQAFMHRAILENKPKTDLNTQQLNRINNLLPAINTGLYKCLGISKADYPSDEERRQVFVKRYNEKMNQLKRFDAVYDSILSISRQRTRGAKTFNLELI